ncbi:hypothetical protein EXIGLDRAFT_314961 [Exidia glandulosa HHB12029]|uniref:Uncharacterized protein n=1 Tax=Exidia glandulosa HHB12029 TaxID=1314781 RepID=A0A165CY56_EXIGL|nr:hypothetical protein EXIGLDRAFT_314961 [Exidia glandulosa HHB12029]
MNTGGHTVNDTMVIDDLDPEWIYTPRRLPAVDGWFTGSNTNYYHQGASFECKYRPNYSASYTFDGAVGVLLHAIVWRDSRTFSILFDDEVYQMDATSHWTENSTVFFVKGNLDPTVRHNLTLVNCSQDVPNCGTVDEFGAPVARFCCQGIDSLTLLTTVTQCVLISAIHYACIDLYALAAQRTAGERSEVFCCTNCRWRSGRGSRNRHRGRSPDSRHPQKTQTRASRLDVRRS